MILKQIVKNVIQIIICFVIKIKSKGLIYLLSNSETVKKYPYIRVDGLSFKEDNLVVCYYLSASEIRPEKRAGLLWEGPYKRGTTEQ